MNAKKSVSMKALVLLLAAVLLFGCAAGGTLAWLVTKSATVTNTCTTSDINITLEETKKDFKMVPGADIAKDPKVTVLANSEACWLFVKIDESENLDTYLEYTVLLSDTEWKTVPGTTGVYYREVAASEVNQEFAVLAGTGDGDLKNGYVHVLDSVTKAMMETAKNNEPTLTFTAYAVQKEGFADAAAAWDEAKKLG